eukprot:scaffold363_cov209-Alexandrium_tamarense.AAC.6
MKKLESALFCSTRFASFFTVMAGKLYMLTLRDVLMLGKSTMRFMSRVVVMKSFGNVTLRH